MNIKHILDIEDEKKVLLIDGDILVYNIAHVVEKINSYDGEKLSNYPLMKVQEMVEKKMDYILFACPHDVVELYLTSTDKSNFRYAEAKTLPYKENRKGKPKPFHYNAIRQFLMNRYKAVVIIGKEADDELSLRATQEMAKGGHPIIATSDKDLNMIECTIYNIGQSKMVKYESGHFDIGYLWKEIKMMKKKHKEKDTYLKKTNTSLKGRGLMWFYAQMILGDIADNIPGVKGVGDVGVYDLLSDCKTEKELFDVVWGLYQEKEYGKDRFLEVARLLWMQTDEIEDIRDYLIERFEI